MFQNYINWRKEEGVDTILQTYDMTEYNAMREHYPHGYHGVDKQMRPVYIERIGIMDVPKTFELSTPERLVKHYIQSYEVHMKLRFPSCSAVAGRRIEQGLTILDMTGGGVTTANKQVYGLVKLAAKVGSDYYPEIMGNTYVINAPMMFTAVWAVVKGMIDEKTRKKIQIVGGSFKKTLLEHIDDENIPSFLGGKCECKEHGGCMVSNIGPWNDYEIVAPKGVKKREKFHPDVNGRPIFYGPDGEPMLAVT